jgi:GNAT superfamily N-acetyltransferase
MVLKIELLNSSTHIRSSFSCGKDSLDRYIRKQASQDIKRRIATVFVLVDDPDLHVLAYYTLSSFTVESTALDPAFSKKLPRYPLLPATLLGRLAVDHKQQRKGLGAVLLADALQKALEASTQVASVAVIVEALDEEAVDFYRKYGFQPFQQNPKKLYLPMKTIAAL